MIHNTTTSFVRKKKPLSSSSPPLSGNQTPSNEGNLKQKLKKRVNDDKKSRAKNKKSKSASDEACEALLSLSGDVGGLVDKTLAAEEYYADRIARHVKEGSINILTSGLMQSETGDDDMSNLLQLFTAEMKEYVGGK